MKPLLLVVLIFTIGIVHPLRSQTIIFSNGRTMDGTVIRTNGNDVIVATDYGTLNFGLENIKEIKEAQPEGSKTQSTNRLADFRAAITGLSKEKWASDLSQIPATVIEKGMFRNVPYVSFRCSEDYEVNIYGDLKEPAAIEAGVYRKLLGDETAKLNCIKFIGSILGATEDRDMLQKLSLKKDLKTRNGLNFEVTPPTDEDAYQGWWITVFFEGKLNGARASAKELGDISVPKANAASTIKAENDDSEWSATELKLARPSDSETISFISPSGAGVTNAEVVRVVDSAYLIWRQGASGGMVRLADLPESLRSRFGYDPSKAAAIYAAEDKRKARAAQVNIPVAQPGSVQAQQAQNLPTDSVSVGSAYSSYQPSSSSGGRVFVHSYVRKDGTFVSSHSRRSPRH